MTTREHHVITSYSIHYTKLYDEAGVQVVPGYEDFGGTNEQLIAEAIKIGYPIMVKASAGGGGKGMRLVKTEADLLNSVNMAKGEAKSAFGDDTVYIEKYISSPSYNFV